MLIMLLILILVDVSEAKKEMYGTFSPHSSDSAELKDCQMYCYNDVFCD